MMIHKKTNIREILPGTYLLEIEKYIDSRGVFIKNYRKKMLEELNINFEILEEFYTESYKDVIRGMHYASPPFAQSKIIICIAGKVIDVVLDIRSGLNYGKYKSIVLDSEYPSLLVIPKGVAHGFRSLSDKSILLYKTDLEYNPSFDLGIKYNSFGYEWNIKSPIISLRDNELVDFNYFNTPFHE